jgi:SAM-dependent methyltransferase
MEREAFQRMAANQKRHWWFSARRRNLRRVLKALPTQGDILEVGCGTGANLEMLSELGTVTGVELDEEARNFARLACPNVKIVAGSLPKGLPRFERPFSVICLFDVLEHIEDDVDSLKALGALLAPGGRIVLTVPAYQWLFGEHDKLHHHLRRYDEKHLSRVIGDAGLKTERLGYFNSLLFPLALAQRFAAQRGFWGNAADEIPGGVINHILESIFGLEGNIMPSRLFPFGLSLLAVLSAGLPMNRPGAPSES